MQNPLDGAAGAPEPERNPGEFDYSVFSGDVVYHKDDFFAYLKEFEGGPRHDTPDDMLCSAFQPGRGRLGGAEREQYDAFHATLDQTLKESLYKLGKYGDHLPLDTQIKSAGPFRSGVDKNLVYSWLEISSPSGKIHYIPDLRVLRGEQIDQETGLFRPERFYKEPVRLLHVMTRQPGGGISHQIDALFVLETAVEAIRHLGQTAYDDYGKEEGSQFSYLRHLIDQHLGGILERRIQAHYGDLKPADKKDLMTYLRSEGIPEVGTFINGFSPSGSILITAVVRMPPANFDIKRTKVHIGVTFEVSVDHFGRFRVEPVDDPRNI